MRLAEGLMRDTAAGSKGGGGGDLDDEDPDMDGWSDMDSSDDEDGGQMYMLIELLS